MAALCGLQFCSQKKKKSKLWGYGEFLGNCYRHVDVHHLLFLTQQKWDHSLIPAGFAALQELGHPSGCHLALSENMQLQPGCWGDREKCLDVLSGGRKVPAALQVCTKEGFVLLDRKEWRSGKAQMRADSP